MHCEEIKIDRRIIARLLSIDGARAGEIVLGLPGDGPSNWRSRTWSAFAEKFVARGMRMLIPEYPAYPVESRTVFPLSEAVQVCNQALNWVEENCGCRPAFVIASSFGGAVALAERKILMSVKAMVLKSPAADLASAYLCELGLDELRSWALSPNADPRNRSLTDALSCNLFGNARHISIPVLIIHGSDDAIVPANQSKVLSAVIPKSRLHLIALCDHNYSQLTHWSEMVDSTIAFIEDFGR